MSNARIIEIPATRQIRSGKNNTMRKMRVAAYCRVSTEEEEQQGSFETQKLYYTEKINSTSEWELAGIYADDGISGIHTKKRDGFNQMIQDCKKKKIDLILTKSISRFARNTLDLSAVPLIHEKTHLPVIVDPSHATGKANLVEPMMIAAVAAGADGLEVEVHYLSLIHI